MAKRIKVNGRTPASSTRKKRVKVGNPKFIGPRELKSELREDADTRWRELNSEFVPAAAMSEADLRAEYESAGAARKNMGKKRARLRGQKGPKKFRAKDEFFGKARDPDFGRGGISTNQRLRRLFARLENEYDGF